MSRSREQESSFDNDPKPSDSPAPRSNRRKFANRLAAWVRWLHIYVSMLGLAVVLFFSVTGLTLNHQDWTLGAIERSESASGQIDSQLLGAASGTDAPRVDQLAIVELLRARHHVRGALTEFRAEAPECTVSFKGPGYSADAFIDVASGRYQLTESSQGLLAVLNDLHKGRDTGPVWSWVIDVSAVLLGLVSLTGLYLIFTLRLKRATGLIIAVVGTLLLVALIVYGVP